MSVFSQIADLTRKTETIASEAQTARRSIDERLEELRDQIRAKRAERDFAKDAPLPHEEAIAAHDAWVDRTAESWWRESALLSNQHFGNPKRPSAPWTPRDPVSWGAKCVYDGPRLKSSFAERAHADERPTGPPLAERPAIVERLGRELAELEAAEEQAVDDMIAAGIVVQHRPEVVQRRGTEKRQQELAVAREAEAKARQAAIDAARAVTVPRGPVHSAYLAPKP